MMRAAWGYTLATVLAGLVVGVAGAALVPAAGAAVWAGALAGVATQVLVFWVMFVWLLPHRRMAAHGAGMAVRMAVFAVVALVVLGESTLSSAATLLALVMVFFVSTVLEPFFLRTDRVKRS